MAFPCHGPYSAQQRIAHLIQRSSFGSDLGCHQLHRPGPFRFAKVKAPTLQQAYCRRRTVHHTATAYTAPLLRDVITSALQQLFGSVGGALLFEVLHCDTEGQASIALDARSVRELQAAARACQHAAPCTHAIRPTVWK